MDNLHEVHIDTMAFGGAGVGRYPSGKVVLVSGAAPDELVRVEVVREKRSHDVAIVREVIEPSPVRVEPPCPSAERCGGCSWMHLEIGAQRSWKARLLRTELERVDLLRSRDMLEDLITGASLHHRSRTRLHLVDGTFGTKMAKSNDVVELVECPILLKDLEAFALDMVVALRSASPKDADVELYVDARGDRGLSATLSTPKQASIWDAISNELDIASVHLAAAHGRPLRVPPRFLREDSAGATLDFVPGVFVQAHRELNARLVEIALEGAGRGDSFAEAYAGVGNFTVHLAQRYQRGIAAEGHGRAAKLLRRNLTDLGPAVEVRAEGDSRTARWLAGKPPRDLLLADPPRSGKGVYKSFRPLFEQAPPNRIVLVSCHPMAAVRDLVRLRDEAGYELRRVVPIDMFPQTHHLELVAVLEKAGGCSQ